MKFIADLHIHSRFSMATARNIDFEQLHISAQRKGITVVGTGDFTHPGWFSEIKEKLVPAEPGLFKLNDADAIIADRLVPKSCRRPVRFILSCEISNIYKKNGRTRKNHNLVFLPDIAAAERFNARLNDIGNITADGRPILGLDAKHLLELSLEISEASFFIPAHIWTPWFSLFGSRSGFDSLEECFEELTPYIVALETGLSSDPAMNRRISGLDGLTLVSNSDAHSPQKLGREANLLETTLSYEGIRSAIASGNTDRFLGTFEFYPEEGKYYLDGHRKCHVSFYPSETKANNGICPVCGKPLTLGVLYRVEALSDRSSGITYLNTTPYYNIIPLIDILSEIGQTGPDAKKVQQQYHAILEKLGSEFDVLTGLSIEQIERAGIPLLAQAIDRMRRHKVTRIPGFDGEFGRIRIFEEDERQQLLGQRPLFLMTKSLCAEPAREKYLSANDHFQGKIPMERVGQPPIKSKNSAVENSVIKSTILSGLNDAQRQAVTYSSGPLLISAGPGTGKTRTLTHRIAYLIKEKKVLPEQILAVTFTAKAAREMKERLAALLEKHCDLPQVATFHAFCLKLLMELPNRFANGVIDEMDRDFFLNRALQIAKIRETGKITVTLNTVKQAIIAAKQHLLGVDAVVDADLSENKIISKIYDIYTTLLEIDRRLDYEDILFQAVAFLETNEAYCHDCRESLKYIFVDEYQDINYAQYRLIQALAPPDKDICVIGDTDQSIYGFRGSEAAYFSRFLSDYPTAGLIHLTQNYRSNQPILEAAVQVIEKSENIDKESSLPVSRIYSDLKGTQCTGMIEAASPKTEAQTVAGLIEKWVGGTGYHQVDTGRIEPANQSEVFSFSDFAILYRTHQQHAAIAEALEKHAIPFQVASRKEIYHDQQIRQLLSLMRVIYNEGSFADFNRIFRLVQPGLSEDTANRFISWAIDNRLSLSSARMNASKFPIAGMGRLRQLQLVAFFRAIEALQKTVTEKPVAETINYLINHSAQLLMEKTPSELKDKLAYLMTLAEEKDKDTTGFFSDIALQTDTDIYLSQAEKVALMTLHSAKGLEFPVVFIVGCEDDFIPFRRNEDEQPDMNEERRLFYVAITRAQRKLYFSWAKNRNIYGKTLSRRISPFVMDIEARLLQRAEPIKEKKKTGPTQLTLF